MSKNAGNIPVGAGAVRGTVRLLSSVAVLTFNAKI